MKRITLLILVAGLIISGIALVSAGKILVSQDPATLFFEFGKHQFKKGDIEDALSSFTKATTINQEFAEAHYNKGVAEHELGNNEEAIQSFTTALSLKEGYVHAHYSLALVYYYEREYASSLNQLLHVLSIEPQNVNALFDAGVIHVERFRKKEEKGRVQKDDLLDLRKAIQYYEHVIAINPEFPHAQSNKDIVENVLNEYTTFLK